MAQGVAEPFIFTDGQGIGVLKCVPWQMRYSTAKDDIDRLNQGWHYPRQNQG